MAIFHVNKGARRCRQGRSGRHAAARDPQPEQVAIHPLFVGGSFGRRANPLPATGRRLGTLALSLSA